MTPKLSLSLSLDSSFEYESKLITICVASSFEYSLALYDSKIQFLLEPFLNYLFVDDPFSRFPFSSLLSALAWRSRLLNSNPRLERSKELRKISSVEVER